MSHYFQKLFENFTSKKVSDDELSNIDLRSFFEGPMIYYTTNLKIIDKNNQFLQNELKSNNLPLKNPPNSKIYLNLPKGWEDHYPVFKTDTLAILTHNDRSFVVSTHINRNIHEKDIRMANKTLLCYITPETFFSLTGENYDKKKVKRAIIAPIINPHLFIKNINGEEKMLNEKSRIASSITFKILNYAPKSQI